MRIIVSDGFLMEEYRKSVSFLGGYSQDLGNTAIRTVGEEMRQAAVPQNTRMIPRVLLKKCTKYKDNTVYTILFIHF